MTRSGKTFTLFIVALFLGVAATWAANRWIQNRLLPSENNQADTATVVVAALDIPFGQKIELAHVTTINWPKNSVPKGVFSDLEQVNGKITNQKVLKGELLLDKRIVDEASGSTLSAMVAPGKRAITVRVNDVIGVAGFLLPGNRVDVLASRKDKSRRAYTDIILENLKVLAVDQTATTERDKPVVVRAVTLEMDPKEAEKLVKATEEGSVQLALRNPLDESEILTRTVSAPKKAIKYKKRSKSKRSSVTVIRGTTVNVSKVKL